MVERIVELVRLDRENFLVRSKHPDAPHADAIALLFSDGLLDIIRREAYDQVVKPMAVGDVKRVRFEMVEVTDE